MVLGRREPDFGRAWRVTVRWVTAAVVVAVAGFLLPPGSRGVFAALAQVLAWYALARVVALRVFARVQRSFEPAWLAAQTRILRAHGFDVVRFTVRDAPAVTRDVYDLTRAGEVDRILSRQERERTGGSASQAVLEFAYRSPGGAGGLAVVRRALSEVEFVRHGHAPAAARVGFPEAEYRSRPHRTRRDQEYPSRAAFWVLSGPVRVTVAAADRLPAGHSAAPRPVHGS
jgi:hypothetical protein